jgi:hypothetical protein
VVLFGPFVFTSKYYKLILPQYERDPSECLPHGSDVVLEDKVLVSRRLEDRETSLGLGLDEKVLQFLKTFLQIN